MGAGLPIPTVWDGDKDSGMVEYRRRRRVTEMARKTEPKDVTAVVAKQNEKMIEVRLRFWTNKISTEKGKVLPKHAQTGGVVRIERNETHGIVPRKPKPFHTLLDVGAIVEKVLIEHGIKLHPSERMRKYMTTPISQ